MGLPWSESSVQAGVQATATNIPVTVQLPTPPGGTYSFTVTEASYTLSVTSPSIVLTNWPPATPISCGDPIIAEVIQEPPYSEAFVEDEINPDIPFLSVPLDPGVSTDHPDCLIEDSNGGAQDLMNFGMTTFDVCRGADTTGKFGSLRWWEYGMVSMSSNDSNPLAQVVFPLPEDFIRDGQFTLQWDAPN